MAAILTGLQQCLSADFGIPTDIKFLFKKEVDGSTIIEEIKAHKCILALASDVFKTGFYGGFEDNGSIVITDAEVTKESFDAMISFIYDKMTNMSNYDFDILCSIYYLADKYNIPVLEKKILEVIQSKEISIENVVDIGVLAVKYEVHDKLAEAIYEACAQRLSRIFNSDLNKAVEYLKKIDADGSLDFFSYKSVMKIMARLKAPESSCLSEFDFKESFEIAEVHESHEVTSSSRRRTQYCLVSPHSIAYHQNLILVTEPDMHRVGCFLDNGFRFYCWLSYPKQFAKTRQQYNSPTSILAMTNTCLVLLERDRLHIFASTGVPIQCIGGEYSGLSEGPQGEIFTLGKNSSGQPVVVKFEKKASSYKATGQIVITIVQEFDNWEKLSKTSCLLYNKGKMYITDEGLHKLYIINLHTMEQVARGYLGSNPGQFKKPTGMLADDLGNILVSDSDNNRFLVFTEEGKFLKVVQQKDVAKLASPQGMIRNNNEVLAVFRGDKEGIKGAVVKFKVSGDTGVSISNKESE